MNDQTPLIRSLATMRSSHPSVPIVMAVACRESTTHALFVENMRSLGVLEQLATVHDMDPLYGRIQVTIYQI